MEPLIKDLALILIVAGAMTLLFKKLKQPLVLGYIVAGFLVSPNMPYMSSVTDLENIKLWSDIGVIFLLFALGLEFSFKKILRMGATPLIAAGAIIASMMLLGGAVGASFGWSKMDCIFLGGMLAMSSTTIIFKAFDDMGLRQQRFAGLVLSVLIIEDILAIVLMVMLSTIAVSTQFNGLQMAGSIANLVFFLVLWFVVGIYLIPWLLRKLKPLLTSETLLILSLGLCFGMVVYADAVGFSAAFGAFIMGSIMAETLEAETIEHLVDPIKNLFGAIFFVSVGMMVDVNLIAQYWLPIVCLILTVILGQMIFGTGGYLLSGQNLKTSLQCGFSMTQIGEFAFILATLGVSLGVTSDFLYPIVVAVSVFTTFTTPYLIKLAGPANTFLDAHLPARAKEFFNRYSEDTPDMQTKTNLWKPYLSLVIRDILIYGVLCIAITSILIDYAAPYVYKLIPSIWGHLLVAVSSLAILSPFIRALMRRHYDAPEVTEIWDATVGLHRAPLYAIRIFRAFLGITIIAYVLGRTVHWGALFGVFGAMAIAGVIMFNNSLKARNLKMSENFSNRFNERDIAAREAERAAAEAAAKTRPQFEGKLIERDIHLADYVVPASIPWAGRTLRDLNLGKRFGIHVVSITRGTRNINIPNADAVIVPGDHIQVMGSDSALASFATTIDALSAFAPETTESHHMELRRIQVTQSTPFLNLSLRESRLREDFHCLLAGIELPGETQLHAPSPDYVFLPGDILWLVAEPDNFDKLS